MDLRAVEKSYARWAPVYDRTFGALTNVGRRRATAILNALGGSVLELGVGTGLATRVHARALPAHRGRTGAQATIGPNR